MENSTITDNHAYDVGGGIYNLGLLDVIHLTISHNLAGDIEEPARSGGIYNRGVISIINSIVAMNVGEDCYNVGDFTALGRNLDSDRSCPDFSHQGLDPLLGVLKGNGGPTFTRLIDWRSPAVDAGDYDLCKLNDQRNYARPFGESCDLGAIELTDEDR